MPAFIFILTMECGFSVRNDLAEKANHLLLCRLARLLRYSAFILAEPEP